MNKFEKVVDGDKLYLKVTNTTEEGNIHIDFKLCSGDKELDAIQEKLEQAIKAKLYEAKTQLEKLPGIIAVLESELSSLQNINNKKV